MKTPITFLLLLLALASHFSCEKDVVSPVKSADLQFERTSDVLLPGDYSGRVDVSYRTINGEEPNVQASDNNGCSVVICETVIAAAAAELKALANLTNEIQYTSVECCLDGQTVYAMLVAYPMMYPAESKMLKTYINGTPASGDGLRPSFDFDLRIESCTENGFDVTVVLPDDMPDDFYFKWSLDDASAGETQGISCVCGSVATVSVARYAENIPLTKAIVLPRCANAIHNSLKSPEHSAY